MSTEKRSTSKVGWLVYWADLEVDDGYLVEERTLYVITLTVVRGIWVLGPVQFPRKAGGNCQQQRTSVT